jgi:hypothetical protein
MLEKEVGMSKFKHGLFAGQRIDCPRKGRLAACLRPSKGRTGFEKCGSGFIIVHIKKRIFRALCFFFTMPCLKGMIQLPIFNSLRNQLCLNQLSPKTAANPSRTLK